MVYERQPLTLAELPGMIETWVQAAGGFVALALAVWLVAYAIDRTNVPGGDKWPSWQKALFGLFLSGAGAAYFVYGIVRITIWLSGRPLEGTLPTFRNIVLTIGGACALLAGGLPFALELGKLRLERIRALAWLSFWEAIRSKVLWIFSFLLLVFLFGDWFLPHKPENQLRTYVEVVYWAMTPLLLVTGVILASFGIPNDLRHQTIHTIVTKPVERFEIFLGRFLGYTTLMTLVLLAMATVSLLYFAVPGRIHPEAARESWRARVPIYGELHLEGVPTQKGIRVARAWDYRRYIPGGPASPARAVWSFRELPGRLDERSVVPCEFAFDIFRTRRAQDDKGVPCTFYFQTRHWSPALKVDYDRQLAEERTKPNADELDIRNRLAERFGYYEYVSHGIFDYRLYAVDVPAGLFRNAAAQDPRGGKSPQSGSETPLVQVSVRGEREHELLGVAKYDLYLLDAERSFWLNFYKGTLGLWFRLCLIIGMAVAASTYLSGVVSLMCAAFLYVAGFFREFIVKVATNAESLGGPAEQFQRLVQRQNLTAPLEETPIKKTGEAFDEAFRWFLHHFLNLIPDVDRFDLSMHVSEGFDISATSLLMCTLLLVGYLLPWAVLAHYLLKSREVAS
jgi:hypothetical protein